MNKNLAFGNKYNTLIYGGAIMAKGKKKDKKNGSNAQKESASNKAQSEQ